MFRFTEYKYMATKPSMGIRLDPEDRKTLDYLAELWNLNAADIVRMAIKSLLKEAKSNNGKIELPFKFKSFSVKHENVKK